MKPVEFKIVEQPRFTALELSEAPVTPPEEFGLALTLKEIAYKGVHVVIEPRNYYFESAGYHDHFGLKIRFKVNDVGFEYEAEYEASTNTVYQRINGKTAEVNNVAIFFDVDRTVTFSPK